MHKSRLEYEFFGLVDSIESIISLSLIYREDSEFGNQFLFIDLPCAVHVGIGHFVYVFGEIRSIFII